MLRYYYDSLSLEFIFLSVPLSVCSQYLNLCLCVCVFLICLPLSAFQHTLTTTTLNLSLVHRVLFCSPMSVILFHLVCFFLFQPTHL